MISEATKRKRRNTIVNRLDRLVDRVITLEREVDDLKKGKG